MIDNVQLWFARDKDNKIVTINEVNKENKDTYFCPLCNSEVIPRQGEINSWCFAHIDKSKCSSETMYHFWVKNKLLQKGDKFIVKSDIAKEYVCKDILVEETFKVGDKEYRPDLTVVTECGETIYFEMNYSNEKKLEDYLDIWIELGNTVVEVDVKTLINSKSEDLPTFKAKYYDGKCFNIKNGEDKVYHDTIGSYKEELIKNNEYNKEKKKEVEKLDWFWKEIQRYKMGEVSIKYVLELMQNIRREDRDLIIIILKKSSCHNIINDCVEYKKEMFCKNINDIVGSIDNKEAIPHIQCKFKTPHFLYDRIYDTYSFDGIYYKNKKLNFSFKNVTKNTIMREISLIENSINREKNFHREINSLLSKNKKLKENFIIQDNKIRLLDFYRNRDFEFTINDYTYETRVQNNVYFKGSIETHGYVVCFNKYDYEGAFNYIHNQIINIINKMQNSIGIDSNLDTDEKVIENDSAVLNSLSDIISNDDVKVKEYNIYYNSNDGYMKYIYFKDYKDKFYLICNKDNLNKGEIQKFVKNNNYTIINIKNINRYSLFTLYESKLTYKIKRHVKLQYKHDDYLKLDKLYMSFDKKDRDYIYLSRYNFVEATEQLKEVEEKIKSFMDNKMNKYKIIDSEHIHSEELNNKIRQILYPMICAKKSNENILKIKLNIQFTRDVNGKLQPWIIKDFIHALDEIFRYNIEIENII